ncbi:hypothetical protein SLS57_012429 [Botryosphaeria dothidea]
MDHRFDTLVSYCRNVDREIRSIEERRQKNKDRPGRSTKAGDKPSTPRQPSNLSRKDRNKHFPRRTPEETQKLRDEGKCFYYKEAGHIAH